MSARNKSPAREILDAASLRRVAVLADADPRTVDRILLGKPVRGAVSDRISAVLLKHGIVPPALEAGQP